VEGDKRLPFECCDVQSGGVAHWAGLRDGDRILGFSHFDAPGHKRQHDWEDDTLSSLNARPAGSLFLLFVDKRVSLSEEEEVLAKKRLDFISARKVSNYHVHYLPFNLLKCGCCGAQSNLKASRRLHELPWFVAKWDKKNKKLASEEPYTVSAEDLQSLQPPPRLHTMRVRIWWWIGRVK